MQYITYDEMPTLTIHEIVVKMEKQIEANLLQVHNTFAKNKLTSIYDSIEFGVVDYDSKSKIEPVMDIYARFIGVQELCDDESEEFVSQYQEIENELKEAIKSLG